MSIQSVISRRGTPTLWAQSVVVEYWDPNSTAFLKSRQLTITRPRDWANAPRHLTRSVLIYCDSEDFITYWEMFRDGDIIANTHATVALGESAHAVCYEIGPDGRIVESWSAMFTFAKFIK